MSGKHFDKHGKLLGLAAIAAGVAVSGTAQAADISATPSVAPVLYNASSGNDEIIAGNAGAYVSVSVVWGANPGDNDQNLVAAFYNGSTNVGTRTISDTNTATAASTFTLSMPAQDAADISGGSYDSVKLILDANDDDFGAASSQYVSLTNTGALDTANAGDSLTTVQANADSISIDSDYAGLKITKAQISGNRVYVTFNVNPANFAAQAQSTLTDIALYNSSDAVISDLVRTNDSDSAGANSKNVFAISAAADAGTSFASTPATIKMVSTDAAGAETATDINDGTLAAGSSGNPNINPSTSVTISDLSSPGLASGTAAIMITDFAGGEATSNATGSQEGLFDFSGDSGTAGADSGSNVFVTIRFDQEVTGLDTINSSTTPSEDDVRITPESAFGSDGTALTTSGEDITVSLALADGYQMFAANDGKSYVVTQDELDEADKSRADDVNNIFDPENPIGTAIQAEVRKAETSGNAISTVLGNKELSSDITAVDAYVGVKIAAEVLTSDSDMNGTLDGVKVDFQHPLTSTSVTSSGATIADRDDHDTTVSISAALDSNDSTGSTVIFSATEADVVALLDTDETEDEELATDATNSTAIPYDFELDSSAITYSAIYDLDTGELMTVSDIGFNGTIADGAKPVVKTAEFSPAEDGTGELELTASEKLAAITAAGTQVEAILIDDVPITLINLNADEGTPVAAAAAAGGTSVTIENMANFDVTTTTTLTISDDPVTGVVDQSAGEDLVTPSAGVVVTEGDTAYNGPEIIHAYAVADASTGMFDHIEVVYDKDVALDSGSGVTAEGLFTLRVFGDGVDGTDDSRIIDVTIPAANVAISGQTVTLTVPGEGIVETADTIVAEYSENGDNKLVSTDANEADAEDDAVDFQDDNGTTIATTATLATMVDDEDTILVKGALNTTSLYTQTIKGAIDGLEDGALIRADVLGYDYVFRVGPNSVVTYTIDGEEVTSQVEIDDPNNLTAPAVDSRLLESINKAKRAGQSSLDLTLLVTSEDTSGGNRLYQATLIEGDAETPATGQRIPVNLNLDTGVISENNGNNGKTNDADVDGKLELVYALTQLNDDTVFAVFDGSDDTFRMTLGTNDVPESAFLMLSVQNPGEDWMAVTSGDSRTDNYYSFNPDIMTTGSAMMVEDIEIDLDDIMAVDLPDNAGEWALIPMPGTPDRMDTVSDTSKDRDRNDNDNKNDKNNSDLNIEGFMVTVRPDTGAPISLWSNDQDGAIGSMDGDEDANHNPADSLDEAFALWGNSLVNSIEVTSTTTYNSIDSHDIGPGVALAYRTENNLADDQKLFYQVTGDAAAVDYMPAGWSAVTLAGTNVDDSIEAIIEVGDGGNEVRSWFRDEDSNSLDVTGDNTDLKACQAYFIYFSEAVDSYDFGK